MELLTLTAIASKINIPESTVRYYARKFAKVLPSVGDGRQKRYRPEAIDMLRIIADMFKENKNEIDIFNHLSHKYPINIDPEPQVQQQSLTVQQQSNLVLNSVATELLQKIADSFNTIADQKKEIERTKNELEVTKKRLEELENKFDRLQLPWWRRLFLK